MTYDIGDGKGNNYWTNMVNSKRHPWNVERHGHEQQRSLCGSLWAGARPFFLKQYGMGIYSVTTRSSL